MVMNNQAIANGFRDHLNKSENYKVIKVHDHHFKVRSDCCEIDLLFERYENSYSIEISEPICQSVPVSPKLLAKQL